MRHDHSGELGGSNEHAQPHLAPLVESRVGGLSAEDEEEREHRRGELVGERGSGEAVSAWPGSKVL
jgi:hypothetical protein